MIISIDGNIGSGKSSVIEIIQTLCTHVLDDIAIYPEDVKRWSDEKWLELFYSDMSKHTFGFQTRILMSFSQLFTHPMYPKKPITLVERNKYSSMLIFSKNALHNRHITQVEYDTLRTLSNMLISWTPDLIIYITTSPDICYERIKKRSRTGEDDISRTYLEDIHSLHNTYTDEMKAMGVSVEVINGNQSLEQVVCDVIHVLCRYTRVNKD